MTIEQVEEMMNECSELGVTSETEIDIDLFTSMIHPRTLRKSLDL